MHCKRWTADDLIKLKAMAQEFPTAQIAVELGRGFSAITVKAHEMQISLRMKPNRGSTPDPGPAGMDLPA